jgi:hypothetical protein
VVHQLAVIRPGFGNLYPAILGEIGRITTYWYSMVPAVGTSNAFGISKITSGFPIVQPSTNRAGGGASLASPSAAPRSAHADNVSISARESDRSFANFPTCGSAGQGGIRRTITASRIAFAHGRVSLYVMKDIGATSPGRWQA